MNINVWLERYDICVNESNSDIIYEFKVILLMIGYWLGIGCKKTIKLLELVVEFVLNSSKLILVERMYIRWVTADDWTFDRDNWILNLVAVNGIPIKREFHPQATTFHIAFVISTNHFL